MNQKNNLIIGLIIAGVVVMSVNVDADPRDFAEGLPNIGIMLKEITCLLYTSPSPRDLSTSRMPSSA